MRKQIDVRLPYLVRTDKGAAFVEYRAFNPETDKLERYRVYKGFASCESETELKQHADKIIKSLTAKLKAGWRPHKADECIYVDQVESYQNALIFGRERKDAKQIRRYVSDYLQFKKAELKPKSYQSYVSKLRTFILWLESQGLEKARPDEISNEIISKFFMYLISGRGLDQRTVAKYKQHLHNLFSWFIEKKVAREIPLKHVPKAIRKVDAAARPITDRHMAIYLDYVKQHDKQLLVASLFQLLLLCRPNQELRLMKIQDVDIAKQVAYIRDETAKTKARVVTMPFALVEIAEMLEMDKYPGDYYIFGRSGRPGPLPVGVNYFNRKFSQVKKVLGLPSTYKFYSFKHTGAGKLLESGASLAELMSHLGHTKFESTIHYVRRHFGEKSEKIMNFRPDFLSGL